MIASRKEPRAGGYIQLYSIGYLRGIAAGWALEHLWPDLASTPEAETKQWQLATPRYPVFLASGAWCGSGTCSADIVAIALEPAAPRLLGSIFGAASSRTDYVGGECENYDYIARPGLPADPAHLFSIRYSGWTAPPGKIKPKHGFELTADILDPGILDPGKELKFSPSITIPTCGR